MMGNFQIVGGIKKLNNNKYNMWAICMMSYLQRQDFWEVADRSETTSPEKDSNGALRKWRIKAPKYVCLEDKNQRRDVKAHLVWKDIKRSMRHIRDIVLKEERYEATTHREWVVINFTMWHDDCSVLPQDQVDLLGDYCTRPEVRHWRSSNEENHYSQIATRI